MALNRGDKLGVYEILSPIGEGGMGEVFRARDTRLDRTVAIKVSKAAFGERFAREAQCRLHELRRKAARAHAEFNSLRRMRRPLSGYNMRTV